MANYNLTNQPISASFQQLLQVNDSNYLVDGTGSLIDELNVTGSISASTYFGDGSNLTGISGGGGSTDTGSLLESASIADATITFTKGDGQTFDITVNNVANAVSASYAVSSSHAEFADNATSATSASYAVSSSHAEQADNATSSSNSISSSVVTDPNIAYINKDNTFTGTQSFLNISVSGTGSFGRIEAVTGSAKIIGDAFVVVNADTPTLRYAGLQVYDSGSSATASIEWDGGTDSWILVEEGGQSSFILTGPTGSKGSEVDLTNNTIPKAGTHRQLVDSIISDDGSTATVSGNINVTGNYNGLDSSSFALLGAANVFTGGTQVAQSTTGTFLSKPNYPSSGFTQRKLWDLSSQSIPIGTGTYNIYQSSFTHFNGYGRWYENGTLFNEAYDGGSYNYGSEQSYNGGGTQFFTIASGSGGLSSGNHAQFQVQDNYDGTTGINVDAQKIYIGQSSSARLSPSDIRIGGSASILVSGSNGYVNQVFPAPAHPSEKPQTTVVGASNGGTAYNRVFQGVLDYSGYGLPQTEDAFAMEYFDGDSYNYGSQYYQNGKYLELGVLPQSGGPSNQSLIQLKDDGDGTSTVSMKATDINIGTTGTTNIAIGASAVPLNLNSSNITISSSLDIEGGLTSSLQSGYVWVGDGTGRTTTAATSSFGGGGGAAFPYTGDAQITGSLGVSGSLVIQQDSYPDNRLGFKSGSTEYVQMYIDTGSEFVPDAWVINHHSAGQILGIANANGWLEVNTVFNLNSNATLRGDVTCRNINQDSGYTATFDKVSVNTTLTLSPQNPLPAGSVGEMAASGSNLYFNDGTVWKEVSFV